VIYDWPTPVATLQSSRMASFKYMLAGAVITLLTACSTVRETNTERTATEQLLLSHAVRDALAELDLSPVDGRTVYLDTAHLKTVDQEFVVVELRARLLSAGAALVDTEDTAELVVEARSAALGTEHSNINLGVPAIPIPAVGILKTPEPPILKNQRQDGLSSLALTARDRATGRLVFSLELKLGRAIKSDWRFLGLRFYRNRKGLPTGLD